jgi:ribosomal protein S27E
MNSIRETNLSSTAADRTLRSLIDEASANLRARGIEEPVPPPPAELPITEPEFLGKSCADCQRRFTTPSEYANCTLCPATVCRAGGCASLHRAVHRLQFLKQSQEQA